MKQAALRCFLRVCICSPALVHSVPLAHHKEAIKLIIDTDLSIDVDDVGAICAAHALADLGEAEILAMIHDTGLSEGVGALSILNEYYGRRIPLGAYKGHVGRPGADLSEPQWTHEGRGSYVDELLAKYASPVRQASNIPDALHVYRETLSEASPSSVTIVAIGLATTLLDLLKSTEDTISPLTGEALVKNKVRRLVLMGGRRKYNPDTQPVEWNFGGCGVGSKWQLKFGPRTGCGSYDDLGGITAEMFSLWPSSVPITLVGFEDGVDVRTGALPRVSGRQSPCQVAYDIFCNAMPDWCERSNWDAEQARLDRELGKYTIAGRASWDPMAVLLAVRGAQDLYRYEQGVNVLNSTHGGNRWIPSKSTGGHSCSVMGKEACGMDKGWSRAVQAYAILPDANKLQVETEIDQLLSNKPRQTAPPGPPAAPNPPAPPPDPPTVELNVVQENADNAGVWGGRCTCPDGNVYWVGDNLNFCASLSCLYGHSGVCHDWQGPWSRRRVTCSLAIPPPPSPAPPSPTRPPSPLPLLPPPPQPPSPCPLIPALQPTQPNSPQEMSVWESLWGRTPPPPTAAPSRPPAATKLYAQQVLIRLDLLTLMIAPALLVYTICYCARRPVTYQEDRGSRSPPPTSGTRHSAKRIPKKKRAAATFEPGVELPLAREEFDNLDIDSLHPNLTPRCSWLLHLIPGLCSRRSQDGSGARRAHGTPHFKVHASCSRAGAIHLGCSSDDDVSVCSSCGPKLHRSDAGRAQWTEQTVAHTAVDI